MRSATLSRLTSIVTFVLVGVTSAVAQLPPPPSEPVVVPRGQGAITFDNTLHDFGAIWDHEKATHKFRFSNTGSETLVITDVRSTCGCTVPELDKKSYEPGESGEITVIFNPENRAGNQRKTINVTTDSRSTPRVGLTITAQVTKVLDIQPRLANLGRVFKGEEKGVKITVLGSIPGFEAVPAEKQPEETQKLFRAELVEHDTADLEGEPKPRSTIRISIPEDLPVGRHSADIVIKTNDDRRPEVTLRATVTIVGDLQARPPRFALGRLEPGKPFEATVTLINRVADPFEITSIEPGPGLENLEITHKPAVEGQADAYEITVRGVAPDTEQTRILGQLVIHTNLKGEETMEMPVYGFVANTTAAARPTPGRVDAATREALRQGNSGG